MRVAVAMTGSRPEGPTAQPGRAGRLTSRRARLVRGTALLSVLALSGAALAACTSGSSSSSTSPATVTCADLASYGTFKGATVTVATAFDGEEADRFDASVADFERCTGIDVVQRASDTLEQDLRGMIEADATATASATASAAASGAASPATATASGKAAASSSATASASGSAVADLAFVPQPGLVRDLARAGAIVPLPESANANIELGWDDSWSQAGTVDGTPFGAPVMASVKSLVWYSPSAFAAAGYQVPQTWDQLVALTKQIEKDHPDGSVTPWCLGIADGDTTGWPMTDWLEDTMLALSGTGAYDSWTSHTTSLASTEAVAALDAAGSLLLSDGAVAGGREGAVSTTVGEATNQLVAGSCLMLHGSSSFESSLPAGTVVADTRGQNGVTVSAAPTADADGTAASAAPSGGAKAGATTDGADASATATASAGGGAAASASATGGSATASSTTGGSATGTVLSAFLFPSADSHSDEGVPVLAGGDFVVATDSDAATTAVLDYLTSAQWAQERIALGGMATANRGVDASQVSSDVARRATELLQDRQTVIRFDASDEMPSAVGTSALWTALTKWTAGEMTSKEALESADKAWPASE